jgi:DDE superfamily endonuclease
LINFVLSLQLNFMRPQQSQLLRVVEALIVGTGRKTMAEMRREWYAAPDESAWSDFFRQSPWEAWTVEEAVAAFTFRDMLNRATAAGAPTILYTSFDDSLTGKDKGTTALDGVDWHHDHTASGGGHYRNGMVHVSCRVQVGDYGYTFSWRLYLRESTVRRLNWQRPVDQRIAFRSKMHLVQEMLRELKPFVP